MKTKLIVLSVLFVLLVSACGAAGSPANPASADQFAGMTATAMISAAQTEVGSITAATSEPTSLPTESATPTTAPIFTAIPPTATLVPSVTPVPTNGNSMTCIQDNSTTDFSERGAIIVNGVESETQVRDANCPRDLFTTSTGVGKGKQYDIKVPTGWTLAIAATSCQIVEDGGKPVDYIETPFIMLRGPWSGKAGCFEAGLHGTVSEWESYLTQVILPIHESEVGHSVTPTILSGE